MIMDLKIKQARLEKDNHECQVSKLLGIAHLSGKPCTEDLDIHHITYDRYGHENINDVITVCTRCHDFLTNFIRSERFSINLPQNDTGFSELCSENIPDNKPQRSINNVEEKKLQINGDKSIYPTQRRHGPSVESVFKSHQGNLREKEKG